MPAPLTLCFLTGTLNAFAGAERMTAVIANALAGSGHRVHVLSLWDRASCFPLDPAVRHDALFEARPSFKRHYAATVAGIRAYLCRHGVQVLIEVDTMLTLFTLPACIGLDVRRVAWEHCDLEQDLGRRARRVARRLAVRTCERVVVLTERDRQRWQDRLRPAAGRIVAIPNALPFPWPDRAAARNRGDDTVRTVLAVGRLTEAKGFDLLLRAWALAAPALPQWRLRIVGDGEQRDALLRLRDELGLAQSASIEPARSDVQSLYRHAALFCLSSRYEGFGLVLIEAMSFGLPIVATACETGPVALLSDGANAALVPPADVRALANGLRELAQDELRMDRLAGTARADAARFAVPAIAAQWERLLAGLPRARQSARYPAPE
ncbi:glycosyltransferase family 4 protein [Cupriavidus sp. AU9028]|uniref:glycosyltransferase family 4 protein n=1 Tax=Cupriavidus sp. AU9028 TaxID=2871157 RepID=UPI001C939C77|nr:glycosyltransferase family 4 protein [Cupriavidus sp. AU9028]MBY4898128.1 glycosyltransferase family 4 protein [Cupriavidus sp. AU9028]